MRRTFALIALIALLLSLSACGGDDDGAGAPAATTTVTVTETPPSPSESPTQAPKTQPQWPTDDVEVPFSGKVPPMPTLVALRVGAHPAGGYDRVAMEFAGLPGYEIGYRSEITYDGSGMPVELTGRAFIQMVFNPAQAHDDEGNATLPTTPVKPVTVGYEALESYVLNGDFEGYVSIALGLVDKVGFNVQNYRKPNGRYVVYIDLAHP